MVKLSKAVENRGGTFIYDVKKAGTVSTFVLLSRLEIFNLTS